MTTAAIGVYPGPGGETFVNLRKGDKGVPLMRLLPASAHGDGWDDFPVAGYFDYAQMWLITPAQWAEVNRLARLGGIMQPGAQRTNIPGFHLEAYGLITDGALDYTRLTELFTIPARLWDHTSLISPQAGLLHTLFQTGLTPDEIFAHITQKATHGTANDQGVLQLDRVKPDAGFRQSTAQTLQKAAQKTGAKQLRKKRKAGKLNRKRGRR